jgi:dTDP-L-rhamnose 4-epimerase
VRVLVTGAAGFIGAAVSDSLLRAGHEVVGIDAMIEQAHGRGASVPENVVRADVRAREQLADLLRGVEVVCHQAAMVGAEVHAADLPDFASHNDLATAALLAAMSERGVSRLVLASSMVVYGDGRYRCDGDGPQPARRRRLADLVAGRFDVACPKCGQPMAWEPVPESAELRPQSAYAASKVAQEHFSRAWARLVRGTVVALRYHNVYGPEMPRDTPYSGAAAMFRSAIESGRRPRVFEDGRQMRDFVHVDDVARANVLAVEAVAARDDDSFAAYNVCSGEPISIGDVARALAGDDPAAVPVTTGEFRPGDVRHIVASPALARDEIGFQARVRPAEGLAELATAPMRDRRPATSG